MKTIAPVVSSIVWSLWAIRGIIVWIGYHPFAPSPDERWDAVSSQFLLGIQVCGVACSVLLWKTGLRLYALLLVPLSLYGGWRAFFGAAIFKMLPALGGLTFNEAMADWWHSNTATAWIFLREVPFAFFLLLSVFFWPLYALFVGREKRVRGASPSP